jgi:hypothetical protein
MVLVVAHRLVTLKQASGIIDLSIMKKNQYNLKVVTKDQLIEQSQYYQDLNSNKISLDE